MYVFDLIFLLSHCMKKSFCNTRPNECKLAVDRTPHKIQFFIKTFKLFDLQFINFNLFSEQVARLS